tara:strand:+ start:6623 stop:7114 length:492 start_codon:yes stop_codon:yes gene_type:complete
MRFTYDECQGMRESSSGACTQCGEFREMCEPDADGYHCESCGADAVQGADNLLAMDLIDEPEDDPTTAAMLGDDPGLMIGRMMIRLIVSRMIKCDGCGAILDQHTAAHMRLAADERGAIACGECFAHCEPKLPKMAQDLGRKGWTLTRWADGESFIPAAGGDA